MATSKLTNPGGETNDSGAQFCMNGQQYFRQIDDLHLTLCVAKSISDAQWLEYLACTLPGVSRVGRMPTATMAAFTGAFPNAKQRSLTNDFLRRNNVKPVDRLGLLSDSPLLRGAIVAFSWVVPNASVQAFGSRDVAGCLRWLREGARFDEKQAALAWSEASAALHVR